jgi:hypothetical protein
MRPRRLLTYTADDMWRIIKSGKELSDWISFVWNILGWLSLTALISGLGATIIATVGAVVKQLPWPLVVAVAWSMFVGTVNLVALPAIFVSLRELRTAPNAPAQAARIVPPHYEAWGDVERFTVGDAACLWEDIEPRAGVWTSAVSARIEGLCGAIRKGELRFIPAKLDTPFDGPTREEKAELIRQQQSNADSETMVGRDQLVAFATAKGYRPRFLFK